MSDAPASVNLQCVNLPRVTGADIPEELFEHILWRLQTPPWTRGQGYPPSRDPTVLTLTSVGLVCKYFAHICRQKLYQNVSFRNQGQVARLLDLVDGGCAPLGKPFIAFTEYIHIDSGEGEIPWAHRIATVLIPRIKNDNIGIIRHVTLNTDKALVGLVPTQVALPRTLPPSLFQDFVQLELHNVLFKRWEDLIRCLFSFRGLQAVTLRMCTCEVGIQHTTRSQRNSRRPRWYSISLEGSRTIAPIMLLATLGIYARHNSVAFLACDQAEAQTFMDSIMLLYDRTMSLPQANRYCRINTSDATQFAVEVGATTEDDMGSQEGTFIRTEIRLQDRAHYNVTMHICKLPMRGTSVDSTLMLDCWHELAGYLARLSHLDTLRLIFESPEQMETFVRVIHPVLQEMCTTGPKLEFGAKIRRYFNPSIWEPASAVFERFGPVPQAEESAEGAGPDASATTKGANLQGDGEMTTGRAAERGVWSESVADSGDA